MGDLHVERIDVGNPHDMADMRDVPRSRLDRGLPFSDIGLISAA